MQEVQQSKEKTLASNRSLAEHNLVLQPELEQKKEQLTSRYRRLQESFESYQLRKSTLGRAAACWGVLGGFTPPSSSFLRLAAWQDWPCLTRPHFLSSSEIGVTRERGSRSCSQAGRVTVPVAAEPENTGTKEGMVGGGGGARGCCLGGFTEAWRCQPETSLGVFPPPAEGTGRTGSAVSGSGRRWSWREARLISLVRPRLTPPFSQRVLTEAVISPILTPLLHF